MADLLTPDLCIIGAGSAGLAVAEAARLHGASVVLVERDRPGGAALNTGAIPSRALAAAAANVHATRRAAAFGAAGEEPRINFRKLHDHVEQVIEELAPHSAMARYEALGAEIINGAARFLDKRTLLAADRRIRAHRFVIATGAEPTVPAIEGLASIPYFTTETIFDNTRKLTHLVIIGGGRLGLELAQSYARLGTEVTVVESGAALGEHDPDLAAVALRRLAEEGVAIRANTSVTAIQPRSMGIGIVIASGGEQDLLDVSHVLVATRRQPNLAQLDLDKAGIRRRPEDPGQLQLSATLRTSNHRVYAVGDVAGGPQSAHAARYQAQLVIHNALFATWSRQQPELLPSVTHTDPQVAEVGLSEAAARARLGSRFRVIRWAFAENDRARTLRQTSGSAKLIIGRSGRILGAGCVGDGAADLIALFSLAIANRLHVSRLAAFQVPYPTLSELAVRLGEAARRDTPPNPLLRHWLALVKLVG